MKMLKMKPEAYDAWRQRKLADLKPRMLGSCALVANGDNLLKGKRGEEIDAHDTIFRHNTPVKGYEKASPSCSAAFHFLAPAYADADADAPADAGHNCASTRLLGRGRVA